MYFITQEKYKSTVLNKYGTVLAKRFLPHIFKINLCTFCFSVLQSLKCVKKKKKTQKATKIPFTSRRKSSQLNTNIS